MEITTDNAHYNRLEIFQPNVDKTREYRIIRKKGNSVVHDAIFEIRRGGFDVRKNFDFVFNTDVSKCYLVQFDDVFVFKLIKDSRTLNIDDCCEFLIKL